MRSARSSGRNDNRLTLADKCALRKCRSSSLVHRSVCTDSQRTDQLIIVYVLAERRCGRVWAPKVDWSSARGARPNADRLRSAAQDLRQVVGFGAGREGKAAAAAASVGFRAQIGRRSKRRAADDDDEWAEWRRAEDLDEEEEEDEQDEEEEESGAVA